MITVRLSVNCVKMSVEDTNLSDTRGTIYINKKFLPIFVAFLYVKRAQQSRGSIQRLLAGATSGLGATWATCPIPKQCTGPAVHLEASCREAACTGDSCIDNKTN